MLLVDYREDYYQEGNHVHARLKVLEAYKRAISTWARWVDQNLDGSRTQIIFRGYSVTHFRYNSFLHVNLAIILMGCHDSGTLFMTYMLCFFGTEVFLRNLLLGSEDE